MVLLLGIAMVTTWMLMRYRNRRRKSASAPTPLEQVERMRRNGEQNNLDPQLLMQVQMRISEAVRQRFGVTDEQVMQAVEIYGAKSDPGFKDILQRIATTLSTSLG